MARRLFLLALVAGTVAAPASASAADPCPGADDTISALNLGPARDAVLCLVNAERTSRGLGAVAHDDRLELAAQRHSEDMLARGFFDHINPEGDDPGDRLTAAGYAWWAYGENIAAGYRTPREVMLGWMHSTGHCHNILDPGVTELGVGVTALAATLSHALGTWTQDFGRPRGTAALGDDRTAQEACPYGALADPAAAPAVAPDVAAPAAPSVPADAPANAPVATTPVAGDATTPVLTVVVKRAGRTLRIAGHAPQRRVRVTLRWHGHRILRTTRRVRAGHYRLRLAGLPRHGRVLVRVRSAALRVTRSVS